MNENLEKKSKEEPRCGWARVSERAHINGGVVHPEEYSFCSRAYAKKEDKCECEGLGNNCKYGSFFPRENPLENQNYQENMKAQK